MSATKTTQQMLHITAQHHCEHETTQEITQLIYKNEASISSMRTAQIQDRQLSCISVTGEWHIINKIDSALKKMHQPEHDILVQQHAMQITPTKYDQTIAYFVNIIAKNEQEVVLDLQNFFTASEIDCETMTVDNYCNFKNSYTPVLVINAKIRMDASLSLSNIREQFMLFCDSLNIDGILDPIRPY